LRERRVSDRKPHDWVPPEKEKSGRAGGNRDPLLVGKSEQQAFCDAYNESPSAGELMRRLGWKKHRFDAQVKRLRRLGYPLKQHKRGRPPGTTNAPGVLVGKKAPPPVLPAASLAIQQAVESSGSDLPVLQRYEGALAGDAATVEKKQRFAATFVANRLSVQATCKATGVSTATYYRWLREDPGFGAMVRQACQEISDEAVSVGVKLAFGEEGGRPDASMVRWVAEKMNPERFSREVRHVHSGTIGHAALQNMTPEEKEAELTKILRIRGITGPVDIEDAEILK